MMQTKELTAIGLGPSWGPSWAVLGSSWAVLGLSWAVLGPSWAVLGPSWAGLEPTWSHLGSSWAPLAPLGLFCEEVSGETLVFQNQRREILYRNGVLDMKCTESL